ncbi:hypothetical protein HCU40_16835 [Pseudanabaena biceps]|nr:hypothetical protein [Pseudanabaena biceps]
MRIAALEALYVLSYRKANFAKTKKEVAPQLPSKNPNNFLKGVAKQHFLKNYC